MQKLSDNQCANILTNLARIWAREHGCEVTRCEIKKEGGETVCLTKKSTYQAAC